MKVSLLTIVLFFLGATTIKAQSTVMTNCGGADDTALLSAAVSLGNPIVIPAGVTCATNDITISVPVIVNHTGFLKPNTGKTARLTKSFWAGGEIPWQGFTNALAGQGSIILPSATEASPVWWGSDATTANDALMIDDGPGINAAQASGAQIINMQGEWGLRSPIFITRGLTDFDGKNRLVSRVYALQADISNGSPNALFIVRAPTWNGSIHRLRFPNGGVSYSGWIISADENGPNGEQSWFSGHAYDLWVDPGSLAAGFFRGGMHNSWFHHIQFESCKYRFLLLDGGVTDSAVIDSIDDYSCYFPFLQAIFSSPGNVARITLSNINVTFHQNDFWLKVKNVADLTLSNIHYLMNDRGTGQTAGFASIENGLRINVGSFNAQRQAGTFVGIKLIKTQAKFHDGYLKDINGSYAVRLEGDGNDVDIDNVRIEDSADFAIDGTSGIGGNLRLRHSIINGAIQYAVNLSGSVNATFTDCEITNGNFGHPASLPLIAINSSGAITFQNSLLGVNDPLANPTFVFLATGTGDWWNFNNRIIGMPESQINSTGSTQVPKRSGNFFTYNGTSAEWH